MARNRKDLAPIDRAAQSILNDLVEVSGVSHRTLAEKTGMSQNRISIILRRDTPPATAGELMAIAQAIGASLSQILAEAEEALREPLAEVRDLSVLRARVESGQVGDVAALDPGYSPEDEQNPDTP